ncbi:cytochrome c oxidase accessory protein CcoG [Terasakiella sp. SH-1]|uniref:cytochrome c oxidase accessory protein CcoG n=1 Tax=Terasakiella sp. SH-1 TaxID=2560057 RepID=UPI001073A7AC|nr:cytochrome c oxidase accessory protein CcoG [Terasakiella sp. SH-1]
MPDTINTATSLSQNKGPLYASPPKIQAKSVKGFYRRLKNSFLWGGLALYHLTPLLRWDRGEGKTDQAVQFDISAQRIYLFAIEVWPQDIYILTGIMIFAAIGLFFSAALWGRAWCGFTCFQTLWTDLFVKVEALIEGDRNARLRLGKAPLSFEKVFKCTLKHSIWLVISAFFSLSFLWYFGDAFQTTQDILNGNISGWSLVTFLTLLIMTYLMAGFAREQVCLYMCPYGRFQGVMLDEHSKVITYEDWRGETRQKPGKNRDFSNRGHCVDCTMCVQVCPTGIDIREGNQMGCIGCGLCIDACDTVMEKFGLPKKLISYDSQHNINQRAGKIPVSLTKSKTSLLRPRNLVYLTILLTTVSLTIFGFSSREMTKITVLKDRVPFFVTLSNGQIQNAYTIRVLNKSDQDKQFGLSASGEYVPELKILGQTDNTIKVAAGQVVTLRVFAKGSAPQTAAQPVTFELRGQQNSETITVKTVFHTGS